MILTRQRVYEAARTARDMAEAAVLEVLHEQPNLQHLAVYCRSACYSAEKAQKLADDWVKSVASK